ncbi:hypothetical protein NE237_025337 [Protea cynaroides]|uniref:Aminotransferase class I/classII large domain-containing protein n=1 Tax=Protea cynaroides TaxID=273540 RepID=A0A9Q0H413_9MAGN|nr:hypothetical protein NE237_025337 [Protea cynaroides]
MKKWGFQANQKLSTAADNIIEVVHSKIRNEIDEDDQRPIIPFGYGDPSFSPLFRTSQIAEDAVVEALRSAKFNSYSPPLGVPQARRGIAEYLSKDLPYKLSPDDVFVTSGATQAIEIILTVLARPGANILLPRPGYSVYEARAACSNLEVRHFDLLPEKGWEADLDAVEAIADENTVAMVIINPGNPCGNVCSYQHLEKVAKTARKLGIMVISDEVFGHLIFGSKPFVPMGVFGSTVPVLTLGSLSKRWLVPGWRLGWFVVNDPTAILKETKVFDSIKGCLHVFSDPTTFVQGAIPYILGKTNKDFYRNIISVLKQNSEVCYNKINEMPCITYPHKSEGSLYAMVKLMPSLLEDIDDDMDFCLKLAKEESVIVLPGTVTGMKNWLRIFFAIEPSYVEDGLERMKSFCHRHAKRH